MLSPILSLVLLITIASAFTPASTEGTDILARQGLLNLVKSYSNRWNFHQQQSSCSFRNIAIRKEWSTLTRPEKRSYIAAVQCLMQKPSISGSLAPGARSRYDDFVGAHINQTLTIHNTGNFLSWHRYFVFTYEEALRNECGYEGRQPYINWGKYSHDLLNAPLFDGSDVSIGGNGAPDPSYTGFWLTNETREFFLPSSGRGGCLTSGPFANATANLGPIPCVLPDCQMNPNPLTGLEYNPRCLRRDLSPVAAMTSTTDKISTDLISQHNDIASFQDYMQGGPLFAHGSLGVHAGGHYWVGGDPGGDVFTSPGDPYFWFHHAQVDRTWWIWQNQDIGSRVHGHNTLAGTVTFNNLPPSRNATLDDIIQLGVNDGFEGITIRDALDTMDGPFCYIYA